MTNALIVVVPTNNFVESALLSGRFVKRIGRKTGNLVALVSCDICSENLSRLNSAFDLVIVCDTNKIVGKTGIDQDWLFVWAITGLGLFPKKIVIPAGILLPEKIADSIIFSDDEDAKFQVSIVKKDGLEWKLVQLLGSDNAKLEQAWKAGGEGTTIICRDVKTEEDLENYFGKGIMVNVTESFAGQLLHQMGKNSPRSGINLGQTDTKDWVAVVGMSCRFPQANNLAEYWDILDNGRNTRSTPPANRTALADMDPEILANFLKCPIDEFDGSFFGMSPSEAGYTDPQARLLLEVSWEAFEEAKINPETLRGTKVGIFYGSWLQEYKEALTEAQGFHHSSKDFLRKYLGNAFGSSAAKLSYFYGFTGPNIATENACSSSMIAVDLAMKSLQRKECPLAVACGANLILYMTQQTKVWAADGLSKTFDAGADGYARSEGIAVLILKRYEDALRDGDNIHGILLGSGSSQEGLSKSFGAPTVESEYSAMSGALRIAKVDPSQVDYVEAHATGTSVGDPIEAAAIVKAYYSKMERDTPLWIGSGKTNMGHSESCSGMAGLIKVMLAMKHQVIPKHLTFTSFNPLIDLSPIPGAIPVEKVPWHRNPNRPRIAGVSSFGITGTDVHVIIQEPPQKIPEQPLSISDPADYHLLALSAKSEAALEKLSNLFQSHLQSSPDSIQDICFTANTCRPHHPYRIASMGRTKQEISENFADPLSTIPNQASRSSSQKICFTFPGKIGTMDLSPFRTLYQTQPYFRKIMNECSDIHQSVTGSAVGLLSALLDAKPAKTLEESIIWYNLIPTCHYTLAKLWLHWGVQPHLLVGHCFGEFSALLISGSMTLEGYYHLTKSLPKFFQCQQNAPAVMMAIGASCDRVEGLIETFLLNNVNQSWWIDVASKNSNGQTIVAGARETLESFGKFCQSQDAPPRCKVVPMDFCAHSRQVEPACQKSLPMFNQVVLKSPKIPYISSATGRLVGVEDLNGMHLCKVLRNCINFTEACATAQERFPTDIFLEMGCDSALTKLTEENLGLGNKSLCLASFSKNGNGILSSVADLYKVGVNFSWDNIHGQEHLQKVPLPHYPFQRRSYWFERKVVEKVGPMLTMPAEKMVHPLLGIQVDATAGMENVTVFQNDWFTNFTLTDHRTKFVADHCIGDKIIFPGAGLLEMILSAWTIAMKTEGGVGNSVKSFKIHAPLLVEETCPKRLQTVVNTDLGTVSIYSTPSRDQLTIPWRLHASGKIAFGEENSEEFPSLAVNSFQEEYRPISPSQFYERVKKLGLNFGEKFKSLKSFRENPVGDIIIEVLFSEQDQSQFLCHPILIDAMIQASMAIRKPDVKRLHIPVQIKKFTWLQKPDNLPTKWYICCRKDSSSISLVNQTGKCVAIMESPELVATSPESVLSSSQNSEQVRSIDLFDVTWQPARFYQMEKYSENLEDNVASTITEMEKSLQIFNTFSNQEQNLDRAMNKLCYLYVVKMLLDLNWNPQENLKDLDPNQFGIVPGLIPAFKHFLTFLENKPVKYQDADQINKEIEEILDTSIVKEYAAMETIHPCGINLSGILTGSVNPHKILFGEGQLANHYYHTTRFSSCLPHIEKIFELLVSLQWNGGDGENRTLRILEVGAGTGAFPRNMVPVLKEMGIKFEYHFTDISPTLVNKAATDLLSEEDRKCFQFKTLNLEVDPLQQGFPPGYFDLIICLDVLHATRDLNKTVGHISTVTRTGGRIFLGETEKPIWEVDVSFGTLEGYWLYEDGIRSGHCTVDSPTWLRILAENGFAGDPSSVLFCQGQMSVISARKTEFVTMKPFAKSWACFHVGKENENLNELKMRVENSTRRELVQISLETGHLGGVELKDRIVSWLDRLMDSLEGIIVWLPEDEKRINPSGVLQPLLNICQHLIKSKLRTFPRLILVTEGCWQIFEGDSLKEQGALCAMAWGFMRNVRVELPGIVSKAVDVQGGVEGAMEQILREMWVDEKELEVAYRAGSRFVRRMTQKDALVKPVAIQKNPDHEFQIELPRSRLLSDLKYAGVEKESISLEAHQVKVEIRCVSLNFRDVFSVLKPTPFFEQFTSIGLDFSGVVVGIGEGVSKWKLGDSVFGCEWVNGCMGSHVKTDENILMAVPNNMTFAEAATLPAVFFTAWHCMVNVAKLRKGNTILVHAASGGVGLAAIQIANLLGVRVIGTAGSEKKRRFVRGQGVEHVFNSRSLDFEHEVKRVTNGQGVDMILNCLTGPGFKEASLAVCKDGGNFVEISKLDIWKNEQVNELRPHVKYDVVDLPQVDLEILQEMMNKLSELLERGKMRSLPYTNFPANRVPEALTFLQRAKQIGKVIITMPRVIEEGYRKDLLFNDRSTYIITGGKGAIGFAVCKWMVSEQGAKYVVLVGRSKASPEIVQEICFLEENYGAKIICKEIDISDFEQVKTLITQEIPEKWGLPPLRGVHHTAGILSDKLIANQDWTNFNSVLEPKVAGAWNLHRATLSLDLEHFVLYSSVACTIGHAGQSNYVAGNAFMDNLANYRNSINLPAISIAWGHWKAGLAIDVSVNWLQSFSLKEGVQALQGIMQDYQQSYIVAGLFIFDNLLPITPHYKNTLFEHISLKKNGPALQTSGAKNGLKYSADATSQISLSEQLNKENDPGQREELVREFVLGVLCETLGTDPDEIKKDVEFSEMGMDSLMSIEFTNKIYSGIEPPAGSGISGGVTNADFIDLEENGTLEKMTRLISSFLQTES